MKSKEDIHLAMAGLTMMAFKNDLPDKDRLIARTSVSLLCWVMDYSNTFDATFASIKKLGYKPEFLEQIIKEVTEAVGKQGQQEQGHSE